MPPRPRPSSAPSDRSRPRPTRAKPGRTPARRPPRSRARPTPADPNDHSQRLQKVLAAAGLGSRRQCEELITAGRVEVDKQTVNELGAKVDPQKQEIRVDGEVLARPKLEYWMVHKPKAVVTTNRDPAGRPLVIDLVPSSERLFAVGRLDLHSEGLILVTNDGELSNLLTHPRYGVEKVYHVQVAGQPGPEVLQRIREGVHLAEGFAHAKHISIRSQQKTSTILEMVLDEGRNREIRRLLASVGHKVQRLRRIALGPLRLAELAVGEARQLRRDEVRALIAAATPPGGRPVESGEGTTSDEARRAAANPAAARAKRKYGRLSKPTGRLTKMAASELAAGERQQRRGSAKPARPAAAGRTGAGRGPGRGRSQGEGRSQAEGRGQGQGRSQAQGQGQGRAGARSKPAPRKPASGRGREER